MPVPFYPPLLGSAGEQPIQHAPTTQLSAEILHHSPPIDSTHKESGGGHTQAHENGRGSHIVADHRPSSGRSERKNRTASKRGREGACTLESGILMMRSGCDKSRVWRRSSSYLGLVRHPNRPLHPPKFIRTIFRQFIAKEQYQISFFLHFDPISSGSVLGRLSNP